MSNEDLIWSIKNGDLESVANHIQTVNLNFLILFENPI